MLITGQQNDTFLAISFLALCCLEATAGKLGSLDRGAVEREVQHVSAAGNKSSSFPSCSRQKDQIILLGACSAGAESCSLGSFM